MKRQVGLWIDHRQAVIVTVADEGEEIKRITSNMEKHVRFASSSSEDGSAEDDWYEAEAELRERFGAADNDVEKVSVSGGDAAGIETTGEQAWQI